MIRYHYSIRAKERLLVVVMKILLILSAFVGILAGYYKYRNWHNPYGVFNILWIVVGLLITKGNEFVYEPSNLAMLIVILGVVGFNCSVFIPRVYVRNPYRYKAERKIDYKSIKVLSYIVLILSIISAVSAIQSVLLGASFAEIRTDYYTYSSSESVWMYYLRNYFVTPMRYVLIVATVIGVFSGLRERAVIINTFLAILLQTITNGGRYVLMNTVFMIMCGSLLFGVKKTLTNKQKFLAFCLFVVLIWGIVYLTNDRASFLTRNMTTFERMEETIYQYFAGSVTYLGVVIDEFPFVSGMTYGVNFIAGLLSPFFVILNFLGILSYPKVFTIIGTYACQQLPIGLNTYYNAMPTIFGYFYIDGGLLLTFIEAGMFGYISKRIYENAECGHLLFVAYYILIIVQICNSSTRWFVYSSDYVLAFFYMLLFIRKKTNSEDLIK